MTSDKILPRGLRVALIAAALALTGCGILPDVKTPTDLYTLSPKNTFDAGLPKVYWQLIVETPVAAAGLNTGRINVASSPLSTDYYATSAWTDRAPLMVQTLLIESFENTKRIVAIGRDAIGLRSNYVVQTELREFQSEIYHGPKPVVRVRLNVKIVRMPERQIIGSRTIERCSEAASDQVPAVVAAFDEALGAVLKRTVTFVLTTPPPRVGEQDDSKLVERFRDPSNLVYDSERCPSDKAPPAVKPKT
ncbi:MAG: ABC-type transport auxiliary lipoprotein family protein [Rhodospirillales bacterium]